MKCNLIHILLLSGWLALPQVTLAVTVAIPTPGGSVSIDIAHAGPTGELVESDLPEDAGFQPPTIFAAPLPTGSGARALGVAGAFTAVADDATAASWNPAGLVQLEYPEASVVYRFSARKDFHESQTSDLKTDSDRYASRELNYVSAVYPFLMNDRNAVVSLNYQESYDFTQEFSARFSGANQQSVDSLVSQVFYETTTNYYSDDNQSLTIISDVTTETLSEINQVLNSALLSGIDFSQQGTIDAFSPAFAIDLSPKFSLGISVNFYTDGASRGNPIESSLTAEYGGTSDSIAEITDTRESTAEISWSGEWYGGRESDPVTTPFSNGQTNTFSSVDTSTLENDYTVKGVYHEENTTEDFFGVNATLGALWAANDKFSFGATVDLPWTGRGRQTKRISHGVTTFDTNLVQVASSIYQETRSSDVEYTFPLYWSVGALWKYSDRLYISLDASQTCWSQFSYKADDEERINPVNGEPYSSSPLDDCWSLRLGGEYLCMLSWTEIPLRGGLFWEQRPASGSPDEYWGFSLGSGISMEKGNRKMMLDVAYIFEQGNNVMGSLLPEQAVCSDVSSHQVFLSSILHF